MFAPNKRHLQQPMFSSISSLPEKILKRLEASWAGAFYQQVFARIDEERFGVLYADEPSRPNIPVNVLVGLEMLKSGFGWSDEEMYDHFCYDVQVRLALGYRDLSEGHFELRTVYNFRQRLTRHMQETGENLFEQVFEQITDEQLAAFEIKTSKLRMDSTMIASNMREMTRLQLLVEVLQRVQRMLSAEDQQQYADAFTPYLKGSSGQYIYHLKAETVAEHLRRTGELMARLTDELAVGYGDEPAYHVLQRVFREHFYVDEGTAPSQGRARTEGQQLAVARRLGSDLSPEAWRRELGLRGQCGRNVPSREQAAVDRQGSKRAEQHRRCRDAERSVARAQGAHRCGRNAHRWRLQQPRCRPNDARVGRGANPDGHPGPQTVGRKVEPGSLRLGTRRRGSTLEGHLSPWATGVCDPRAK